MWLLKWLFSSQKAHPPSFSGRPEWRISERGNATLDYRGQRLTAYLDGRYWKFCAAPLPDGEPFFSESFESEAAAKEEALAFVEGRPRSNPTIQEIKQASRPPWTETVTETAAATLASLTLKLNEELPYKGKRLHILKDVEKRAIKSKKSLNFTLEKSSSQLSLAQKFQITSAISALNEIESRAGAEIERRKSGLASQSLNEGSAAEPGSE